MSDEKEEWTDEAYERLNGLTTMRHNIPATFEVEMTKWTYHGKDVVPEVRIDSGASEWWCDLMYRAKQPDYDIPEYIITVRENSYTSNTRNAWEKRDDGRRVRGRYECKQYDLTAGSEQGWAHPLDGTHISVGAVVTAFIEMLEREGLLTDEGKLENAPATFQFGAHNGW